MKDRFKVIGYYICEINDTPGWQQGISRQILSVSGCVGEQHPRWECYRRSAAWTSSRLYRRLLGISDDWIAKKYVSSLPLLAYRVAPALYEQFLDKRWEAGVFDRGVYELHHTPAERSG